MRIIETITSFFTEPDWITVLTALAALIVWIVKLISSEANSRRDVSELKEAVSQLNVTCDKLNQLMDKQYYLLEKRVSIIEHELDLNKGGDKNGKNH
ncbi:hypothetical protein [Lentilactobacillus kefiri]|uniref:hypothetical protein n=1 Tax=Lentilactobacillus kefiri TaxID=33962 RepID=UPI000BA5FD08|nr:hypothetical protein [Lentilactobacillus kefiri]PAK82488.1 hypothetical protein B8W85_08275 [Lentilactobacillus kefiri]